MNTPSSIHEWSLRSEILEISHRWRQVFVAFLLGSLVGWCAAYLFPSPYRGLTEIYVAYNGDAIFRNSDDYKNWQFGELEAYVVSNDVMDETLRRLRQQDPYWEAVTNAQLRPHLQAFWRNAGKWRLAADWQGRERSTQLNQAWSDVVLEKTKSAAEHARTVLVLEAQLDAISRGDVDVRSRLIQLTQIRQALQVWRGEHGQQSGDPMDILARWRLEFLAASAAGFLPGTLALSEQFPPPEAEPSVYLPGLDQAIVTLDEALAILGAQSSDLTTQRETLMVRWQEETKASHNLTANLQIEAISSDKPTVQPIRPTSQMALVGGCLGILAWGLVWLGRPARVAGR
jgi:hypothetical protein